MATEEEVRTLKRRYAASLFQHPAVASVGVERDDDGDYTLTVHLTDSSVEVHGALPKELEGHRVRYVATEPFRKL